MSNNLNGNVFHKFALRSLKANRVRTVVTVIGIILSMALFTAVIEGANSGIQFLINSEIAVEGCWEGGFYGVDSEFARTVQEDDRVKKSGRIGTVGWAEFSTDNDEKPYVVIENIEEGFTDVVAVILEEGRMPENPSEIVVPAHLIRYAGDIELGEEIELGVGRRTLNGEELSSHDMYVAGEELTGVVNKKYTVVGICGRNNPKIEPYGSAGFMVYTTGADSTTMKDVYFTMKNNREIYDFLDSFGCPNCVTHTDLLAYNGVFGNSGVITTIYGLMAILVLLIVFGLVTLIYSSFSISVGERTRQFGILKSIGATKKQIRSAVLFETFLLSAVGIIIGALVGCLGIGLTLHFLRDDFASLFTYGEMVDLKLVISPVGLVAAAVICLVTVLISAWIPAGRAVRVSAIDSIRQTQDISISAKKLKTSGLITRAFGFEGMMARKNFKRNKKRSRSVIISIFLSMVLFITASSFSAYLMNTVSGFGSGDWGADIRVSVEYPNDLTLEKIHGKISAIDGVDSSSYMRYTVALLASEADCLTENGKNSPFFDGEVMNGVNTSVYVAFLDDASFNWLCSENGFDSNRYYEGEIRALLSNEPNYLVTDEKDEHVYMVNAEIFDEKQLPFRLTDASGAGLVVDGILKDNGGILPTSHPAVILPYSRFSEAGLSGNDGIWYGIVMVKTEKHREVNSQILALKLGVSTYDSAEAYESSRMLVKIMGVFTFGFIIIISLIAIANIFNTISTNVMLRRREVAMMKSVGLSNRGFRKMMNYECIIYGLKGLLWGLPVSLILTYLIFKVTAETYNAGFYIPWYTLVIAIGSVFVVVFAAMWYASAKIKKDNVIDALKNENI